MYIGIKAYTLALVHHLMHTKKNIQCVLSWGWSEMNFNKFGKYLHSLFTGLWAFGIDCQSVRSPLPSSSSSL